MVRDCVLCDGSGHWVTIRYARQALNLTDKQINALPSILAQAPNGILWSIIQVKATQYHGQEAGNGNGI